MCGGVTSASDIVKKNSMLVTPVVYSYFDDLREVDGFAFARWWTSIGVYGRRDSAAQAD
jgi:hypothetical protein